MIHKMFSVFDKAVNAFLPPFFAPSVGSAIRSFTDAVNDPKTPFNAHATDYILFHVSDWDDGTGIAVSMEPHRIMGANEVIRSQD